MRWWWIPGALVIVAAAYLTIDALLEPEQPYRAIVVLVELVAAFAVALVGAALLHAAEALRDRFAASERPAALPRAISRRARELRRRP
jgi:hypothetical protein